jgi:hypothetical protein
LIELGTWRIPEFGPEPEESISTLVPNLARQPNHDLPCSSELAAQIIVFKT